MRPIKQFFLKFRLVLIPVLLLFCGLTGALGAGFFDSYFVTRPTMPDDPMEFEPVTFNRHAMAAPVQIPEGWPQLFGPVRSNTIPQDRIVRLNWESETPPEAWRIPVGTGYSSPIVSRQRVVLQHRLGDEELTSCFQLADGKVIWEYRTPATYVCPHPPYSSGPYSTPIIDGDRVYLQTASGQVTCLDFETGGMLWSRELSQEFQVPENVFAVGHSPLLDNHQLILNLGAGAQNAGMISLDKMTGQTLWQGTEHGASYATPTVAEIHGQRYCFALTASHAIALDASSGELFWQFPLKAKTPDFVNATSPVVSGDVVIFTAYQGGTIYSRIMPDRTREEIRFDKRTLISQFNPMTSLNGYLYGWHFLDKSFRCIHLETGELKWKWVSGIGRGTHVISGDQILLFGESGKVALVSTNPEELTILKEAGSPLMQDHAYSAPAVSGNRVLIRDEKELLCLEIPQ